MIQHPLVEIIKDSLSEEEKLAQLQATITAETGLLNLNEDQESLLYIAAKKGYLLICRWLVLHYPYLLDSRNKYGNHILIPATFSFNNEVFIFLQSYRPDLLREKNQFGNHILHIITRYDNLQWLINITPQLPKEYLLTKNIYGMQPISYAVLYDQLNAVLWILQQWPDSPDIYKQQFLEAAQVAAICGKLDIIKTLYVRKSDWLNISVYNHYTPIQAAAYFGQQPLVEWLLQKFPAALQELYNKELRLIDLAIHSGSLVLVKFLASNGSNSLSSYLNQANAIGIFPLHYAVESRNVELVEWLLMQGADPNVIAENPAIKKSSYIYYHFTAAHIAAGYGDIDILALLKRFKANLKLYDSHGLTPLHVAILEHKAEALEWLIIHAGNIHKRTKDKDNHRHSAMHLAALSGGYRLIELLYKYAERINSPNVKGLYPVHLAAMGADYWFRFVAPDRATRLCGRSHPYNSQAFVERPWKSRESHYVETLKKLLAYGANLSQLTANGANNNACHFAAGGDNLDILMFLHEQRVPINQANTYGYFPIHYAAMNNFSGTPYTNKVIPWLLEQGVPVNQPSLNDKPVTPFTLTLTHSHSFDEDKLITLDTLNAYRVNLAFPIKGKSPLLWTIKHNKADCMNWLLQNSANPDHILAHNKYALALTALYDSDRCLKILLEYPIKHWEQPDRFHHTPFTVALAHNRIKALNLFIKLKEVIDKQLENSQSNWPGFMQARTSYGWAPIHYLSLLKIKPHKRFDISAIELVLAQEKEDQTPCIDINAQTLSGETLLHLVMKQLNTEANLEKQSQYLPLISLLLKYGLNPHILDHSGEIAYANVFRNILKAYDKLEFAKRLLEVFKEHGIWIPYHCLNLTFNEIKCSAYDNEKYLQFILDYFPGAYSGIINNMNENIQEETFWPTLIKYGFLNGQVLFLNQARLIPNRLEANFKKKFLALGVSVLEREERSLKKIAKVLICNSATFNPESITIQERLFLLNLLSAFLIHPPIIFTESMKKETNILFHKLARSTIGQEALNIITHLLDYSALSNSLTVAVQYQLKQLYLEIYQNYHKKLPSLMELSMDVLIRLPGGNPAQKQDKIHLNNQLTLVGSQFGRIREKREYILNKFIVENEDTPSVIEPQPLKNNK